MAAVVSVATEEIEVTGVEEEVSVITLEAETGFPKVEAELELAEMIASSWMTASLFRVFPRV